MPSSNQAKYSEPPFLDPLTAGFAYVAWSVDPATRGPFVRRSTIRSRQIDDIRAVGAAVEDDPGVDSVQVFEATFIPPLAGTPDNDVVMLIRTTTPAEAARLVSGHLIADTRPAMTFLATNGARFGVTEDGQEGCNILLNHFTGSAERTEAIATWRRVSAWYADKLGVDNSTLLVTREPAPFAVVNYVRLSGPVVAFLLRQLLRPSFHRYVRRQLTQAGLTSLPVFFRAVPVKNEDSA